MPSLRRLELWEYDAANAAALGPLATQLEVLTLHHLGAPGIEALLARGELPALRELDVRHTAIADRRADAIAASAPHLTHLGLGSNAATERTLIEAVAALPELRHLRLAPFGELEGLPLIEAGVAPRLRTLVGSRWSARPEARLRALAAAPTARSLRTVDLPTQEAWSDEVLAALVGSPHLTELGTLTVPSQLSEAQLSLLLRRFGHRFALPHGAFPGPLPDPDLDPWWS